ncbi:MAG: helix-turn-helix transcriptional regulator [Bacteroidetes bacterium]|nr:helix-turn-helix transcriptional regulator [Bacteroidota bacterium]
MKNLSIKNMVCNRCIRVVKEDLEAMGHEIRSIKLGEVILGKPVDENQLSQIREKLEASGFELIDDEQVKTIEEVKTLVIEHIHHHKEKPDYLNFSDFLAERMEKNYTNLSRLFSAMEGITIEKYIILQKIERVKELLLYGEQSLSEIAFELGYSSVAHLSGQFKKVTGLSPTAFQKMIEPRRKSLDQINE